MAGEINFGILDPKLGASFATGYNEAEDRRNELAARVQQRALGEQQLQHDRAAMGLQFQHMLAGIGMRAGEEQRKALVNRFALGVEKAQVSRLARPQVACADRRDQGLQV